MKRLRLSCAIVIALCVFAIFAVEARAQSNPPGGPPLPRVRGIQNCLYGLQRRPRWFRRPERSPLKAGTLNAHLMSATVYCSAAADITFAQNGAAATCDHARDQRD